MTINSKKVGFTKPIKSNSSKKKRVDPKVRLPLMFLENLAEININLQFGNSYDGKNTKRDDKPVYVFAFLLTKKNRTKRPDFNNKGKLQTFNNKTKFLQKYE